LGRIIIDISPESKTGGSIKETYPVENKEVAGELQALRIHLPLGESGYSPSDERAVLLTIDKLKRMVPGLRVSSEGQTGRAGTGP
jgi:hypothetical protein